MARPKKNSIEGMNLSRAVDTSLIKPSVSGAFFSDKHATIKLYHGDAVAVVEGLIAAHPQGLFDMIFADPPYFLSNGGITCHSGKRVKVDKGKWDVSQGVELNHEFHKKWLQTCQRALKPNGTIWISGTHHVIYSVGFALEQVGFRILNHISWEKTNPPPNLSCRYFKHSTESIIWAAKTPESKHLFNYDLMRKVNGGKQMASVWRDSTFLGGEDLLTTLWTMPAPSKEEKQFGKHPTQKPVALVERCVLASTVAGGLVLDPFMGSGTTGVACVRNRRGFIGIEGDKNHAALALARIKAELVSTP